jgi:hypothetical protein
VGWRVAANILNKQSRTADKGWPSSLGVGRGLTTPHHKKYSTLRNVTEGLGLGRSKEDEMGGACGVHGGGEGCIQHFGWEA